MLDGGTIRGTSPPRRAHGVEDVGLADPRGLEIALAAAATFERLGSPRANWRSRSNRLPGGSAQSRIALYSAYNAARALVQGDASRPCRCTCATHHAADEGLATVRATVTLTTSQAPTPPVNAIFRKDLHHSASTSRRTVGSRRASASGWLNCGLGTPRDRPRTPDSSRAMRQGAFGQVHLRGPGARENAHHATAPFPSQSIPLAEQSLLAALIAPCAALYSGSGLNNNASASPTRPFRNCHAGHQRAAQGRHAVAERLRARGYELDIEGFNALEAERKSMQVRTEDCRRVAMLCPSRSAR